MKTLLFAPELFRAEGGIARILRAYLHALVRARPPGSSVGAIVLNDSPASLSRMPAYLRAADISPTALANRSKARFIAASLRHGVRADRIVCGHIHLASVARLVQWINPRMRYYVIAHGIDVWRPYTRTERSDLGGAHRILCVSEYTRRQILRFMPSLDPAKLAIVPNTLDPDFALPPDPRPPQSRTGPRILTVARLTTNDTFKGVDTLIEAMPLICGQLPGARLVVVGGGNDEARLRSLAQQCGGADVIEFLGITDDARLRGEYAQCDLFALPSRKEGFGLVFLEAMSFGKPCLGARAGGVPEVVTDAVGELVEYGRIDQIADACIRLSERRLDPGEIRSHVGRFSFEAFCRNLNAALADDDGT
jgi:glycosyltransferase involved in cell wall biosynthesis